MADEDKEFSFSGKEPRIKESHEEFTTIVKMNQGAARESKENKETK